MKLSIPLKDIMIAPGKRFDPAEYTDQDVIIRIKKFYGVIGSKCLRQSQLVPPDAGDRLECNCR